MSLKIHNKIETYYGYDNKRHYRESNVISYTNNKRNLINGRIEGEFLYYQFNEDDFQIINRKLREQGKRAFGKQYNSYYREILVTLQYMAKQKFSPKKFLKSILNMFSPPIRNFSRKKF